MNLQLISFIRNFYDNFYVGRINDFLTDFFVRSADFFYLILFFFNNFFMLFSWDQRIFYLIFFNIFFLREILSPKLFYKSFYAKVTFYQRHSASHYIPEVTKTTLRKNDFAEKNDFLESLPSHFFPHLTCGTEKSELPKS